MGGSNSKGKSWFEGVFGFDELRPPRGSDSRCGSGIRSPEAVRKNLSLCGASEEALTDPGGDAPPEHFMRDPLARPPHFEVQLEGRSSSRPRRISAGHFFVSSVAGLRDAAARLGCDSDDDGVRAAASGSGERGARATLEHVATGDVLALHSRFPRATFMAASQFNGLEFPNAGTVPEAGITRYDTDPTQGPACALACPAGTVFRNYFVPVTAEVAGPAASISSGGNGCNRGQSRDAQIDNTVGVARALAALTGSPSPFFTVKNGYLFADRTQLRRFSETVPRSFGDTLRRSVVDRVRVCVQAGAEVAFQSRWAAVDASERPLTVTQCYASAASVAYNTFRDTRAWEPLAQVFLDAAFEATLWCACVDLASGRGSGVVWLTPIGAGAFGNPPTWVGRAIARAVHRVRHWPLDIRVAHYRRVDPAITSACAQESAHLASEDP